MELTQIPTGNFTDYVIQGRFEESAGGFGYGVFQIEKPIAQSEFCCNKSQWITRCFRGKCRRSAQAGVYLDDTIIFTFRVVGILHIALAHNTDVTDDSDGKFTQFVIVRIT